LVLEITDVAIAPHFESQDIATQVSTVWPGFDILSRGVVAFDAGKSSTPDESAGGYGWASNYLAAAFLGSHWC
jgi:hypothetical protein